MTRTIPTAIAAEEAVLGAAMLSSNALEVLVTDLEADDFYRPAHQCVYDACRRLWESGIERLDPLLVSEELKSMGLLGSVGGPAVLVSMQANVPATSAAAGYAALVADAAVMRRVMGTGAELSALGADPTVDAREAVEQANYLVSQISLPVRHAVPSPSAADLCAIEKDHDWLVEGLLERKDRLIITAAEGKGKSMLLRQLGVTFAAGIHPFRFNPITPLRVLLVDVENSITQVVSALRPMMNIPARQVDWSNLRIEVRTDGLDLASRHDQRWLYERVVSNRPDVLITGPIYKLHADDPNDEKSARRVAQVFDRIRAKYDCAVILEAHAPHGDSTGARSLRPFGSSLWMRWPEFGYGLKPDRNPDGGDEIMPVTFRSWRGPRAERAWPLRLLPGMAGEWPWRDSNYRPAADRDEF